MLNEHGMKDAKPVVTLAVNRNNDEEEGASAEERRILRRNVGKSVLGSSPSRHCFCYEPSGEVPGKTFKIGRHCVEASLAISAGTMDFGLKLQGQNRACSTLTAFTDSDWAGDRPTRKVRVFVGDHAGWILAQCRFPNTVGDC